MEKQLIRQNSLCNIPSSDSLSVPTVLWPLVVLSLFLPRASWFIKFIRGLTKESADYIHIGTFMNQKGSFHKQICLRKLVLAAERLFRALIHFPNREMKDECVPTQDSSNRLLCILPECFCGRKCLRAPQFVISKQRHHLEQYSLLFPISFLPGARLYLISSVSCGSSHPYCWQSALVYPPVEW